jgi:RNA recognition motif-containing protein
MNFNRTQPTTTHYSHTSAEVTPATEESPWKIFLGCVPGTATDESLTQFFSKFGRIVAVNLRTRQSDGKCAGFGKIVCADEATFRSILGAKTILIEGRKLVTKKFLPEEEMLKERDSLSRRKLLVRNVKHTITDAEFENYFAQFGDIEICYVVRPKNCNDVKLHGFVIYRDQNVASRVLSKKHTLKN